MHRACLTPRPLTSSELHCSSAVEVQVGTEAALGLLARMCGWLMAFPHCTRVCASDWDPVGTDLISKWLQSPV